LFFWSRYCRKIDLHKIFFSPQRWGEAENTQN
jgi:hypothetical protein